MEVMRSREVVVLLLSVLIVAAGKHHNNSDPMKKFNILARPQTPASMTVIMRGMDGTIGRSGSQGDAGSPGIIGPHGPTGDKGFPGVCSRAQCENEELKAIIQRLLALEKYVNSKNNSNNGSNSNNRSNSMNKNNASEVKACVKNLKITIPSLPPCPQTATITIIPFPFPAPQPKPAVSPGTAPVPSSSVTKPTGGTTGRPPLQTPSPANIPTSSSSRGTPRPMSVTVQGVTTYDNPLLTGIPSAPPGPAPYSVSLNSFVSPATWVSSGNGPIELQPLQSTQSGTSPQGWALLKKKNKIPSSQNPRHGLLTHDLTNKMLHSTKSKTKKTHVKQTKSPPHPKTGHKDKIHHSKKHQEHTNTHKRH